MMGFLNRSLSVFKIMRCFLQTKNLVKHCSTQFILLLEQFLRSIFSYSGCCTVKPENPWGYAYRSAFFIPVIVSYVSITMVWQWLYNEDYGLINTFLGKLGLYQPPWLTSEQWAMPSVIIMSIWKNLGFNAVILLAGVQGISP